VRRLVRETKPGAGQFVTNLKADVLGPQAGNAPAAHHVLEPRHQNVPILLKPFNTTALMNTVKSLTNKDQEIREAPCSATESASFKGLCNDVGVQRNCLQAMIELHRAKNVARALLAAQRRFERLKRTRDWRVYADFSEIVSETLSTAS
jgi:hypothetical protein